MEKTFDELTSDDWQLFKRYVCMDTYLYTQILNSVNKHVQSKYFEKPNQIVDNSDWTVKFSIENIYPSKFIISPAFTFNTIICNKKIDQTLSNGIKVSIQAFINDNDMKYGGHNLLRAFDDISLNIHIDFSNLTHNDSDVDTINNFRFDDYDMVYYMCTLFYIEYDVKKEIYIEFEDIIANLYKDLQNSYNTLCRTLYYELNDYIYLFDLPDDKLKDYMSKNFNWIVVFDDEKHKIRNIKT